MRIRIRMKKSREMLHQSTSETMLKRVWRYGSIMEKVEVKEV